MFVDWLKQAEWITKTDFDEKKKKNQDVLFVSLINRFMIE